MPGIKAAQDVPVVEEVANQSNGDSVVSLLVGISILLGMSVILSTASCRRRAFNFDCCPTVKRYIQKTAWCVSINGVATAALYMYIKSQTLHRPIKCMNPYHHITFLYLVFGAVCVAGAVRYTAVGLAQSDTYDVAGYKVHNPVTHGVLERGSTFTWSGYQLLLSPYFGCALVLGVPLGLLVVGLLPQGLHSLLEEFQICMSDGETSSNTKTVFYLILLLLSVCCVILVEGVFTIRSGNFADLPHAYKCPKVLNSPYVAGTLSSTYSFWLAMAVLVYLCKASATFSDYLLLLQYLTAVDAFWLTLLCFIAAQNNKVLDM